MTKQEFKHLLSNNIIVLDGATGSCLQQEGMPTGICPEQWILENPEVMLELQKEYVLAGSDIIYAPTFTCNRIKLDEYGLVDRIGEINTALVELSKEAIRIAQKEGAHKPCYVAGDITMTGEQIVPIGTMPFEELVDIYKEQVGYLVEAGVDLIVVETMMSLQECRAAVLAIKETSDIPILVTLSFNEDGRTLYGTDPTTAVAVLQSLGVDAVGANCSSGADQMIPIIKEMASVSYIPIIAKPNCGMPILNNGVTVYNQTADEFLQGIDGLVNAGATIVGGCCGTNVECISKVSSYIDKMDKESVLECVIQKRVMARKLRMLSSERRSLVIEDDKKLFVVGERINPTGKKDLQASLREKNMDLIITMAEEQEEFGADVLDVNVGMNGIDEVEILFQAVTELSQAMNLPLSIDTSNVEAMEKALRNYPGRALMNSISLDPEKMQRLIPMAKKYGAMFVLLPLSEEGLPKNLEEKKSIIRTIVDEAKKYGITENEIVVDGLVTTVGANKKAAIETLETIRYCKYELGLATVCGLSNISFGLPERSFVNSTFLALAIKEGLTMAIANPMQELLMNVSYATDLLLDRTHADERYVERVTEFNPSHYQLKEFGTKEATRNKPFEEEHVEQETPDSELYEAVLKGRKELTISYTKRALERGMSAEDIIQEVLIKAIDQVGKLFEIGRYFLPQLMNSAEAMKAAVEYLEPLMTQESNVSSLGVVVVATVKGDIHDIGKNLVGIMLKNCGFEVHDLGKNIDAEEIIDAAKRFKADLIGLSALMTTTMMEMKNVVDLAKDQGVSSKIMIGGAVVTEDFAKEIGANAYSSDAGDAVKVAKRLMKSE